MGVNRTSAMQAVSRAGDRVSRGDFSRGLSSLAALFFLSTAAAEPSPDPAPAAGSQRAAPAPVTPSAGAAAPARGYYITRSGTAMGTAVQIRVFVDEPEATHSAEKEAAVGAQIEAAFAEIRRLEALMTTWRPESEISRINAAAGKGAIKVSPEVLDVVERSLHFARISGGAFDISFYALKGLWRFDDDLSPTLPDPAEIKRRLPLISWRQILVDRGASTVRLGKPGMAINLGGIGKGYAVDAAVRVLKAAGLRSGLVQAGGDLMIFGSKGGQPFMAGVRDPRSADPSDYFAVCPIVDHAFSTAGDYERAFIYPKDRKRYHHILDPRTGYPARAARSVTVYAKDATLADGLDDAILILGVKRGLALIESIPEAGAIIVDDQNRVHISSRLQKLVRIVHPPSDGI
jgi:thiamine biosynthesis lipoprotein